MLLPQQVIDQNVSDDSSNDGICGMVGHLTSTPSPYRTGSYFRATIGFALPTHIKPFSFSSTTDGLRIDFIRYHWYTKVLKIYTLTVDGLQYCCCNQ